MEPIPSSESFGELRRALGAAEQRGWRTWWSRVWGDGAQVEPDGGGNPPGRHRKLLVGVGTALLGAAAVVGVSAMRTPRPPGPPAQIAAAPEYPVGPTPTPAPAPAEEPPPEPPLAERIWPVETPVIDGNVVSVGGRRWEVGGEGDVVAVGDWDCDGDATPAALRTRSGTLFVFDEWAGPGEERQAKRVTVSPGALRLESRGCGRAALGRGDGSFILIETGPGR